MKKKKRHGPDFQELAIAIFSLNREFLTEPANLVSSVGIPLKAYAYLLGNRRNTGLCDRGMMF
ncbi:hypothetical protein AYK26_07385 [Euryarchaeota archaeon SM23-78]|nr:MAG: hypothetical protein AYK26_07385 [Euryarchaeota archaeon SM23-78]